MSEQIGFRSQLTPDPLSSVDAGVCGVPAGQCAGEASEYAAVESVVILGTLIALGERRADCSALRPECFG